LAKTQDAINGTCPPNVSIWIDSEKKAEPTLGVAVYRWDTTENTNGVHNITIFAKDIAGNSDQLEMQIMVSNSYPIIIPIIAVAGVGVIIMIIVLRKKGII